MKQFKIAIIVAALSAAGVIVWWSHRDENGLPNTDESATEWMCASCKHVFSLTASAYGDAAAKAGGPSPLFCPACGEKQAYRVATCDYCGTKYFSSEVPGQPGVCPNCNPDAPILKPTIEEPESAEERPVEEEMDMSGAGPPKRRSPPAY